MATGYVVSKIKGQNSRAVQEFTCDTIAMRDSIPKHLYAMGDTAYVIANGLTYIATSTKQWAVKQNSGSGGSGVGDAPVDGKIYGRKDAAWVQVQDGEKEVFRVDTKYDLPAFGNHEAIYIVSDTNDTYIWQDSPPGYKATGAQGTIDEITIISGGSV